MTKQRFITAFSAIIRNNPGVDLVNTLTVIRRTSFHQEPWMIAIATSWHFIIILMHPLNCLESPLST